MENKNNNNNLVEIELNKTNEIKRNDSRIKDILQNTILNNNNDNESDDDEKEISICCSNSSVYGLKYLSRMIISSSIIFFSFYEIATSDPDKDNSIYFSLLSSILGYYLSNAEQTYHKRKR